MILWRISNHVTLDGAGGLRASGRWHSRGRHIVYCARSPSAALLEMLAHLELDVADLPSRFTLLKIRTPARLRVERADARKLGERWKERTTLTRAIGDEWLVSKRTALLDVPSALVPDTRHILINPAHADAARLTIVAAESHELDLRLVPGNQRQSFRPR